MPTLEEQVHRFDDVERVIANEEKFKARLGAGKGAFASLRVVDLLNEVWNVGGAAGAGAGLAASSTVASTFFAPTGLAAFFGFGAAVTPIGWVIGAGAAAGGLYYGVTSLFRTYHASRVDEIPRFLNSPVDVLGATFFDLVGSLAVKLAAIDGHIDDREREVIAAYFVEEWGYDPVYALRAMELLEEKTNDQRLGEMSRTLAEFARTNPDCDFTKIRRGLSELLTEIAEADGRVDEREELAIEKIVGALRQEVSPRSAFKRAIRTPVDTARSAGDWVKSKLSPGSRKGEH